MHKTVTFGRGVFTYNVDVALVQPKYSDWAAVHGAALPKHQAIMALEGFTDHKLAPEGTISPVFAINTGQWLLMLPMVDRALANFVCPTAHHPFTLCHLTFVAVPLQVLTAI